MNCTGHWTEECPTKNYNSLCNDTIRQAFYPFNKVESDIVGCWCILNAVVGFTGNLLTLLAIPLAKRNERQEEHQQPTVLNTI